MKPKPTDEDSWRTAKADARRIGREHGESAAAWWEQEAIGGHARGDTIALARRVLRGIEDGDPEILVEDDEGELCDAYEVAYDEALQDAVTRYCRLEIA